MTDADIANAIRKSYPKHNKTAFSLAKRTPETGVMLCPGAQSIMDDVLEKKKPRRHVNPYQMRARLPKELEARVKAKAKDQGTTLQAVIIMLLTEWLERREAA